MFAPGLASCRAWPWRYHLLLGSVPEAGGEAKPQRQASPAESERFNPQISKPRQGRLPSGGAGLGKGSCVGFWGCEDLSFTSAGDSDNEECHRDLFPWGWSVLQAAWWLFVVAEGATSPLSPLGGKGGSSQLVLPSSILPTPPWDGWSVSQVPLPGAGYRPVTRCSRAVSIGVSLRPSKTHLEALPFSLLLRWSMDGFPGRVLGLKSHRDLLVLPRDPSRSELEAAGMWSRDQVQPWGLCVCSAAPSLASPAVFLSRSCLRWEEAELLVFCCPLVLFFRDLCGGAWCWGPSGALASCGRRACAAGGDREHRLPRWLVLWLSGAVRSG